MKTPRLKIKVPFDTALEIAQKGIGEYGPKAGEVLPGIRVVAMTSYYSHSGMTGGEEHRFIELVVQWGDKFYKNEEPYCEYSSRWGEVGDPDTEVFPQGGKREKVTVSFVEVFPETVTFIRYK